MCVGTYACHSTHVEVRRQLNLQEWVLLHMVPRTELSSSGLAVAAYTHSAILPTPRMNIFLNGSKNRTSWSQSRNEHAPELLVLTSWSPAGHSWGQHP